MPVSDSLEYMQIATSIFVSTKMAEKDFDGVPFFAQHQSEDCLHQIPEMTRN